MTRETLAQLFEWRPLRWLAALAFLVRGSIYHLLGAHYRAMEDFCWIERVSGIRHCRRVARARIDRLIDQVRSTGHNPLVAWYLQSSRSRSCASKFQIAGGGPHDLFRDLIVLKASTADERGVILLKYARTFEAVVALLDFARLRSRYTLVLEPCWAGYCDTALLLHFDPAHPTLIQCFTDEDQAFVRDVGGPFVPVRLGPADWVNADIFGDGPDAEKTYDLVMVANWGAHKRHRVLFHALQDIRDRDVRVLLAGFPWAGRTADDIRNEAGRIGNPRVTVEIAENLPHPELAKLLASCKIFVFLSRKEGDNKALVEAMFANVPAIVFADSVGGARGRINDATGMLARDAGLADAIRYMLDHYREFRPRTWARANSGSHIATRIVDDALQRIARERGDSYRTGIVEKTNAPNLKYRDEAVRERFDADYAFVNSCLRSSR